MKNPHVAFDGRSSAAHHLGHFLTLQALGKKHDDAPLGRRQWRTRLGRSLGRRETVRGWNDHLELDATSLTSLPLDTRHSDRVSVGATMEGYIPNPALEVAKKTALVPKARTSIRTARVISLGIERP